MSAKSILETLYAPHKVFKEIIQNQKFMGPLLVMILFIAAGTASQYAKNNKIYLQQTTPTSTDINNPDPWTEDSKLWISNANVTNNGNDHILGKNSIQFNMENDTRMLMKLNATFSINCIEADGYKNLTFALKWIQPSAAAPENVTLYLFSQSEANYLYTNLTGKVDALGNSNWGNLTIPLGPSVGQWTNSTPQATWSNITGFKMSVVWPQSAKSNLTVLIDRMFFSSNNYESLGTVPGNDITYSVFTFAVDFALYWMIFGIVLFVVARLLSTKAELKTLLIIIGYSLIAFFVMQVVLGIFYAAMPSLKISLDGTIQPMSIYTLLVSFTYYVTLLFPIWSIVITALGMREAFNLTMRRSIIVAVIAFFPYYLLLLIG